MYIVTYVVYVLELEIVARICRYNFPNSMETLESHFSGSEIRRMVLVSHIRYYYAILGYYQILVTMRY